MKTKILINKIISLSTYYNIVKFKSFNKFLLLFNIKTLPKIITVTGTNGKGTTVYLLSKILTKYNINNIIHVSPHLYKFNERIMYNLKKINDSDLHIFLHKIYFACITLQYSLNFYSIAFLCSLLFAIQKKPLWLILEIGIGGKLDPANILNPNISIITSISYDHCEILGSSLNKIALNKAHIARKNRPIIIGVDEKFLPKSSKMYLKKIKAKTIYTNKINIQYNYFPIHNNIISCVLTALPYISKKINLTNIYNINIDGRFEILSKDPYLILDVSHNVESTKNFIENIKLYFNNKNIKINALFMTKSNKNMINIMKNIKKDINLWILPNLSSIDDNFLSISTKEFKNFNNIKIFDYHYDAFKYFINKNKKNTVFIVFGSFILVKYFSIFYKKINLTKKINIFQH